MAGSWWLRSSVATLLDQAIEHPTHFFDDRDLNSVVVVVRRRKSHPLSRISSLDLDFSLRTERDVGDDSRDTALPLTPPPLSDVRRNGDPLCASDLRCKFRIAHDEEKTPDVLNFSRAHDRASA